MVNALSIAAIAASLLTVPVVNAAGGMYERGSPVLEVNAKSYRSLVENSNHTTILEFYAPWCGHCKNLKPAYEKAAKSLAGLAKVAAVNCDEEFNKAFCGQHGIQGFPTLKIVKPGKKVGRPFIEDYQGPRDAKGIVEAVKSKIPMHVKRLTDKTVDEWLTADNSSAKAILFTNKGTVSPLLKALAVDFLGSISIAQVRDKEADAVELFGITTFPTLVLLPGGNAEALVHKGDMTKQSLSTFLSQVAPPNPDPAPQSAKAAKSSSSKSKDPKKSKSASSAFSKASASHQEEDASSAKASQTAETLVEDGPPIESPDPQIVTDDSQVPVQLPEAAARIPNLVDVVEVQKNCLNMKSGTCILAIHDKETLEPDSDIEGIILALSELRHKYTSSGHRVFPIYSVSGGAGKIIRETFSTSADQPLALIAMNIKRGWTKPFDGTDMSFVAIEEWFDKIRMGEGTKQSVPDSLIGEAGFKPAEKIKFNAPTQGDKEEEEEEMSEEVYQDLLKRVSEPGFDPKEITPKMKQQLMRKAMAASNLGGHNHAERDEL